MATDYVKLLGLDKPWIEPKEDNMRFFLIYEQDIKNLTSQKARGIWCLARRVHSFFSTSNIAGSMVIHKATEVLDLSYAHFPFFARPCPKVPCHGFVDSRVVNNQDEIMKVIEETRKAEPDHLEILLSKPITADWSGVLTVNSLTLGPGNDGATSGYGAIVLPTKTNKYSMLSHLNLDGTGLDGLSPFLEFVHPKGVEAPEAVQLRGGPEVGADLDFIPYDVRVKKVHLAKGDLLEWAQATKDFKPGDVVYHPEGSPTSHYSIHAYH
jgi:hypothetical protein